MSEQLTYNYNDWPNPYFLTPEQIALLQKTYDEQLTKFKDKSYEIGLGGPIYQLILDFISDKTETFDPYGGSHISYSPKAGVNVAVWTWITGAIKVNAGDGFAADFIRDYTVIEFQIRDGFKSSISDVEKYNQEGSNQIALRLASTAQAAYALPFK